MNEGTGPVVLVTGAASGIGAATARALAAPGVGLLLHTGLNEAGLEAVAGTAREMGARVSLALGEVADPEVPARLVARALEDFGRLDQIVSNAARAQKILFEEMDDRDLETAYAMMPLAFFRLAKAALPQLRRSARGRVVAVSSFVAHGFGTGGMHFPASGSAKAALEALAKSLAVQVAPDGVTVNCVVPGFTSKDKAGHAATSVAAMEGTRNVIPNGRLGDPADVAAVVAFLLSDGASHMTGQCLHVDGGLLLP